MPTTNAQVLSRGLPAGKVISPEKEEEEEESNLLGSLPRPPCTLSKPRVKFLEEFVKFLEELLLPLMPQMYVYVMYVCVCVCVCNVSCICM